MSAGLIKQVAGPAWLEETGSIRMLWGIDGWLYCGWIKGLDYGVLMNIQDFCTLAGKRRFDWSFRKNGLKMTMTRVLLYSLWENRIFSNFQ